MNLIEINQSILFLAITINDEDSADISKSDPISDRVVLRAFNITVRRRDVATLDNLNWLNDVSINFYMNLLCERQQPLKFFPISSYFITKMEQDGIESVKSWTENVNIFGYDVIFIPINSSNKHWTLAVSLLF